MAKEFIFRGKTLEELKAMDIKELTKYLPARQRRSLNRGMGVQTLALLKKIRRGSKRLQTHARDAIILPEMVGVLIKIHNGKEFIPVDITEDMLGHYLGEFALTRKRVQHGAPGIGASRSSAAMSVK